MLESQGKTGKTTARLHCIQSRIHLQYNAKQNKTVEFKESIPTKVYSHDGNSVQTKLW